jgi:ferritin
MIHPEIESAINAQINQELTAAHSYLGMAAYFDVLNLDGFSRWMSLQHDEEGDHAKRLFRYLLDRGGKVQLGAIPAPDFDAGDHVRLFEVALSQEQANTKSINELYELATKHNDHATKSHLQWFIDEQVEEEASIDEILGHLTLAGDDTAALLYLNDKLGQRQAEAPAGAGA